MWHVCQNAVCEDWWYQLSEQEQNDGTAVVELAATCANDAFSPMATPCVCQSPQQPEHPAQAMTRSFSELTKDFSPECRERIEQR